MRRVPRLTFLFILLTVLAAFAAFFYLGVSTQWFSSKPITVSPNITQSRQILLKCNNFHVSYPANWHEVENIDTPLLTPYDLKTIMYPRGSNNEDIGMVDIIVACYKQDQQVNLKDWLTQFYTFDDMFRNTYAKAATTTVDLTKGSPGGLDKTIALLHATAHTDEEVYKTGKLMFVDYVDGFLSYDVIAHHGVKMSEVGHFWQNLLTYDAFISGPGPYIYLIRLNLRFPVSVITWQPSEQYYAKVFQDLLDTATTTP